MLNCPVVREYSRAVIREIDIYKSAAAAVVAPCHAHRRMVTPVEAVGIAVVGIDIDPVDLEPQFRRRSPYEGSHSAITYRQSFFAVLHSPLVGQISAGYQVSVINR